MSDPTAAELQAMLTSKVMFEGFVRLSPGECAAFDSYLRTAADHEAVIEAARGDAERWLVAYEKMARHARAADEQAEVWEDENQQLRARIAKLEDQNANTQSR